MKIVKICFKKMNKRLHAWLVVNIKLKKVKNYKQDKKKC